MHLFEQLYQAERTYVLHALRLHRFNRTRTARWLGISRRLLLIKLATYQTHSKTYRTGTRTHGHDQKRRSEI